MKRLLLATVLLSTAMSDDILTKEEQRVHEGQLWPRRKSWLPREEFHPGIDDLSTYATRVTGDSGTTVLSKPLKLPPLTFARSRSAQYGTPSATEYKVVNPTLLLTLDFRRVLDKDDKYTSGCNSEKCRRRMEKWRIQRPIYVDEPRWIEIKSDYSNKFDNRASFNPVDPFVLSRGKKIMRLDESIEDDSDNPRFQDLDETELLRSRRSIGPGKYHEKRMDRTEKILEKTEDDWRTETKKDTNYPGDFERIQAHKDPFFLTRGKKLNVADRRYQRLDDRLKAIYANKMTVARNLMRGKRSLDYNSEDNQGSHENQSPKVSKKLIKDSQLESANSWTSNEASTGFDDKETFANNRGKRSSYESGSSEDVAVDKDDFTDVQWFKDLRGSDDGASYVNRRDKHADFQEILSQPFFISRGKKGMDFNEEVQCQTQDFDKLINILAFKIILNNIMENNMKKCGAGICGNDLGKIIKKKAPRGRRGALDKLLANYDPFFVARGKRPSSSFLEAPGKGAPVSSD